MVDDVAGEDDVLLDLVELLGLDRGERVLLRLDRAVLERQVDFGEGDRGGVGAAGARHGEIGRHVGHAHLQALHVRAALDRLVRRGLPGAVVGDGDDVVAGLVLVALRQLLEDVALGVGQEMVRVAEGVGIVGDADRREAARGEARARDDDVDAAKGQALVEVRLLAELRGRIDVDVVAAVGPLLDLLRRPDQFGVERLGRLVDVRPFELGLGCGRAGRRPESQGRDEREGQGRYGSVHRCLHWWTLGVLITTFSSRRRCR